MVNLAGRQGVSGCLPLTYATLLLLLALPLGTGLLAHCVQSAFHGLRFDTAPTDLTVLAHAGRWGLSGCKHWLIVAGGVVMPSGRAELARKFQLQISAGAKTEI